jgi:O-methyltransferase
MRIEDSRGSAGGEVGAAPPGPDREELRQAYLDVLKLCLCDLAGPSTTSVRGLAQGRAASRELAGEELSLRAEGRDWPAHGLTMVGLRRLNDLQRCVEQLVSDGIEGDLIEAGCWRGGASILMRATLDSLGETDRTVWAADSFQGFPRPGAPAGRERGDPDTMELYLAVFDFLAAPQEEVQAAFERFGLKRGTRLVPGFFEDTLPRLAAGPWSLIRLDADTYDSTLLALRCLYPRLTRGGYLIVDDYDALDECRAAVDRFREDHSITDPLEHVDWTCVRWRRSSDAAIEAPVPSPTPGPKRSAPPRPKDRRIPTEHELALAEQLADAHERLKRTEDELAAARDFEQRFEQVTGSTSWRLTRPLRELGVWLRGLRRSG